MSESKKSVNAVTKPNRGDKQTVSDLKQPRVSAVTEQRDIIWPEWNDAEVTAEKWDLSKGPLKSASRSKDSKSTATSVPGTADVIVFEDAYPTPLPWSIRTSCNNWIKLSALYPGVTPVIFSTETAYPDLVTLNRHLLSSEFFRSFIASVYNLMYLGYTRPFPVEWQTSTFNANTASQPWKPWHHIYSMCKAGEGAHNPQVNNSATYSLLLADLMDRTLRVFRNLKSVALLTFYRSRIKALISGKYVVRLFWMGCWRKVTVDAFIPVDSSLQILLPASNNPNKLQFELWPVILAKALLKIASLTWTPVEELVEFDIIQCLTGWVVQKIDITDLEMLEKWDVITGYADHFEWDNQPNAADGDAKAKKGKKEKKEKSGKGKKGKDVKGVKPKNLPPSSFQLVAVCRDLMNPEKDIADVTPCPSHGFLLDKTRDIPMFSEPDPSKVLPAWKEYRWVTWAVEKGIWEPVEKPENIKYCRIISNFRKISTDPAPSPSRISELIKKQIEMAEEIKKSKGAKGAKGGKTDKGGKDQKSKEKGSKPSSKDPKKKLPLEIEDPSIWIHFYNICDNINYLNIYLMPSLIPSTVILSDLEVKSAKVKKEDKGTFQAVPAKCVRLRWLNGLKRSHNEPFYLFSDSIDYKYLVFNLSHVCSKMPLPNFKYKIKSEKPICQKEICLLSLCDDDCSCQDRDESVEEIEEFVDARHTGCAIVEEYDWTKRHLGATVFYLNAYGSKSFVVELKPGRVIWRVWLKSSTHLVLTILSDTDMTVGAAEDVLEKMALESELVLKLSYDICTAFGNLVKYYGTEEFLTYLRSYYKVYLSNLELTKHESRTMHEVFMNTFLRVLEEQITDQDKLPCIRALRALFVDPTLRFPHQEDRKATSNIRQLLSDSEICQCVDPMEEKKKERAAVTIQAFFKMIYVRKLKQKRLGTNPQYPLTFEILRLIYNIMFSAKPRLVTCPSVIRRYVYASKMEKLRQFLPYYKDIRNVIKKNKISGAIPKPGQNSWVPLCRFNLHVVDVRLVRFYIRSDLPEYVLRVFENDMDEEIERYTNVALVSEYSPNDSDYTVVAYGWSRNESFKSCSWEINVVREDVRDLEDIVIDNPGIEITTIRGEYVPNLGNKLFTYVLSSDDHEILTFRLSLSSENVKVTLKCLAKSIHGSSNVILPCVPVQFKKIGSDSIVFNLMKSDQPSYHSQSTKNLSRLSVKTLPRGWSWKKRFCPLGSQEFESTSTMSSEVSFSDTKLSISKLFSESTFDNITTPVYTVEAFIEKNSWPLTQDEWDRVEARKTKESIEQELRDVAKGKGDAKLPVKRTGPVSSEEVLPPSWELTIIHTKGTPLKVEADRIRIEEIKAIKRIRFDNDIRNLLKGKELRHDFIDKYKPHVHFSEADQKFGEDFANFEEFYNSQESGEDDSSTNESFSSHICSECNKPMSVSELKYVLNPKSSRSFLPTFRMNKVYEFDYFRRVMSDKDVKAFRKILTENDNAFQMNYLQSLNKIEDFYQNSMEKQRRLYDHMKEVTDDSREIYNDLEIKRSEYIKRKKDDELESLQGKKSGKDKKKK